MSDPIQHVVDLLPDYLDQKLSDAERGTIEAHLQICAECEVQRQELVQKRETPVAPSDTPSTEPAGTPPPPPENIDEILRQDLPAAEASPPRLKFKLEGRALKIAGAVVVGLVLALIVWVMQMRSIPDAPPPPASLPDVAAPAETPSSAAPPATETTAGSVPPVTETAPATPAVATGEDSVAELQALVAKASGRRKAATAVPKVAAPVKPPIIKEASQVETPAPVEVESITMETPADPTAPRVNEGESTVLAPSIPEAAPALMEWQGLNSGIKKFQTFVIRTPQDMQSMWQKHSPGSDVPAVDFDRFMVVGVTKGQSLIRGAAIEVMGTRPSTDGVTVYYREVTATGEQLPRLSNYTPYHFKVVAKSSLKVTFQQL